MRTIFRIARLELCSLFFSPIGWLVLLIFLLQTGTTFFDYANLVATSQESSGHFSALTSDFFTHFFHGLFPALQKNMYLYIPLLTMGLMARETSSGSIKLLLSSPVKIREIVLGKYFSMLIFSSLLLSVTCLFVLVGVLSIDHPDVPLLISGMLGLFLLMATYSAIGLFMSSLTTHQVVAAISTLAVLAFLNFIREIGQGIEVFRKFTYFISLSGRADHLISGLITSRDLLYFVFVSLFFLSLTAIKLKGERTSGKLRKQVISYAGISFLFFALVLLSSQNFLTAYFDATAAKSQTVTANTRAILQQIKKPITVTIYTNVDEFESYHGERMFRNPELDFWAPYQRFLPELNIRYVYYYDTPAEDYLLRLNPGKSLAQIAEMWANARDIDPKSILNPAQIHQLINLKPDENRTERVLTMDGKQASLHWFRDAESEPFESEIDPAIKHLLMDAPVFGFLSGNEERSIQRKDEKDYYTTVKDLTYRGSLSSKGFKSIDLPFSGKTVPAELSAIVIAAPQTPFTPVQLESLRSYIRKGGNALILGEPGSQANLNPLLKDLGVELMPGRLAQKSHDFGAEHIEAALTPASVQLLPGLAAGYGRSKLVLEGASGLKITGGGAYHVTTLAETDPGTTWNSLQSKLMDSLQMAAIHLPPDNPPIPVAIALTRSIGKRQQRIVICGDAGMMSSKNYPNPSYADGLLTVESFKWFCYGQFPIDVSRPAPLDNVLKINHQQARQLDIALVWVLPILLILAAALLLIYRNRR